jgi:hypothetical protein
MHGEQKTSCQPQRRNTKGAKLFKGQSSADALKQLPLDNCYDRCVADDSLVEINKEESLA